MSNNVLHCNPHKTYVTDCVFLLPYDYYIVGDGTNRR